ncbi:MAG: hypothetical protein LBR50_00670 [Tannerella sp.]|jgi:hypothetical protein|nr:hypothetical protein [Tannerella sp.]
MKLELIIGILGALGGITILFTAWQRIMDLLFPVRTATKQIINTLAHEFIDDGDDISEERIAIIVGGRCNQYRILSSDKIKSILKKAIYEFEQRKIVGLPQAIINLYDKIIDGLQKMKMDIDVVIVEDTTIQAYLIKFCDQLEDDKSYELRNIKAGFEKFLSNNGKIAKGTAQQAHILAAIANNRNRFHYNAINPKEDELFREGGKRSLLLYYPDENNHKIVKKFSRNIKEDITIYWFEKAKDGEERPSIKLSELNGLQPSVIFPDISTKQKGDRGDATPKTIWEFLSKFCSQLEDDKPYELRNIMTSFAEFLVVNGRSAKESAQKAHILAAIANNRNRFHYNAINPKEDGLFIESGKRTLLLYYPDENNHKIVKKFGLNINDDPTIYWYEEGGNRPSIKLSELKKEIFNN